MRLGDARELRIYIVDDGRGAASEFASALAGCGQVDVFEDADAALAAISSSPPDLVLCDCVMPGMSGTQLVERIRAEGPGVDVVLIADEASVDAAVATLRMGATDYLRKPLQPEQLRRVVELALERRLLKLENAQLSASLETLEACRALAPCLELGEVYPVALDLMLGAAGATRGLSVFRRSSVPQGDGIAFRGFNEAQARALRSLLIDEKRVDLDQCTTLASQDSGPLVDALREAGADVDRVLAVPVWSGEREGGVIWLVEEAGHAIGTMELDLVRAIQKHSEVSIHNAERYSNAKERAFIDDVTEVYNARYLMSATDNEIRRAERYGNSLSVVFLDLDRFKLVNDRHGHLIGSQTLRNLSKLLLEEIRQVDTLARYGGDEFTVLLADTPHEAAVHVAERIRRRVEEHLFECGSAPPLRLTISAGVASQPEHGRTREALLDASDKAMYRAKSLGRNRTCSADELPAVGSDAGARND